MEFEAIIGLEIHAELNCETKAFCSCPVAFAKEANSCTCPVCMGMPGALPTLNKKVPEYAVMLGIALNCKIREKSQHARKNYFYPDLPKDYQISQAKLPICYDGCVELDDKKIRINRIHIEEDAGKLIHMDGKTLIDYNRAGVPLVEIVTEPDLRSAKEAKLLLEKIKENLLYLGISECKMQQCNLRCDVNVSVRRKGDTVYNQRCEMKNVNSISAMERCINYEINRQIEIYKQGGSIQRQTRRWIDEKNESVVLREKESIGEYRYFPDPDLPCIEVTEAVLLKIKSAMPELPEIKRSRYLDNYALTKYECEEIMRVKAFTKILDEAVEHKAPAKKAYNYLVSDIARLINEKNITPDEIPFGGKQIAELIAMIEEGKITSTTAKDVIGCMFSENKSPSEIVKENNFTQLEDPKLLKAVVLDVLAENQKSVDDYKKGKKKAMGFIMGECMRKTHNRANASILSLVIREELEK